MPTVDNCNKYFLLIAIKADAISKTAPLLKIQQTGRNFRIKWLSESLSLIVPFKLIEHFVLFSTEWTKVSVLCMFF